MEKKINSYKMLLVIDHSCRFIFVSVSLGNNDREVYTTSPLYLEEGAFFSPGEYVAADGGFESDGRFLCSYKNPGNDRNKIIFHLAFCEVRTEAENSYQQQAEMHSSENY